MIPLQNTSVMTVCGPISPAALGWCQIHEHIFVHDTPAALRNPALRLDDPQLSLQELLAYRQAGGRTICDAQPVGAGRDAALLRQLSEQSGVSIIASTGYHLPVFYEPDCWLSGLEEDALYELYCEELTLGMLPWEPDTARKPAQRTGIRAGMVKAAIGADGPVGQAALRLRAAARAAADCGCVLMLHTERGQCGLDAIQLAAACGLAPQRMIVCHADRQAADFAPHDALAKTGVYLDYDTIGRFRYHSDEQELALLRHMLDSGFGAQLLLSLDTTAARLQAYGGEISLCYILKTFMPMLRQAGLPQRWLERVMTQNCSKLFTFERMI